MSKKRDVTIDSMVKVKPITDNQKLVFAEYDKGQNLFLYGAAAQVKHSFLCTLHYKKS